MLEAANGWHAVLEALIPIIITALTGIGAWLAKKVNDFLHEKAQESSTGEYAAWAATAFNLAGIAVKYAETKFGPDTANGAKKKQEAVYWLTARLKAIDPNLKIAPGDLEAFVDAAYHDVFVALRPLAPSQP